MARDPSSAAVRLASGAAPRRSNTASGSAEGQLGSLLIANLATGHTEAAPGLGRLERAIGSLPQLPGLAQRAQRRVVVPGRQLDRALGRRGGGLQRRASVLIGDCPQLAGRRRRGLQVEPGDRDLDLRREQPGPGQAVGFLGQRSAQRGRRRVLAALGQA
jgi:hypothetical protein